MNMHAMSEILKNPSLVDEFFVVVKLAKGFRYRYLFEVDNIEQVDMNDTNHSKNHKGKITNFVEVMDGAMTVEDFIKNGIQEGESNMRKLDSEIREMTGIGSMM